MISKDSETQWQSRKALSSPPFTSAPNLQLLNNYQSKRLKVAQWCLTLCNPMGYTVCGILQARILEGVAFPFSRGSSQLRDRTQVSHVAGRFFTSWATREAQEYWSGQPIPSPGDYPDPGIKLRSPALQVHSFPTELSGKDPLHPPPQKKDWNPPKKKIFYIQRHRRNHEKGCICNIIKSHTPQVGNLQTGE